MVRHRERRQYYSDLGYEVRQSWPKDVDEGLLNYGTGVARVIGYTTTSAQVRCHLQSRW